MNVNFTLKNQDNKEVNSAEEDEEFWKSKSYHTPEDRRKIAQKIMEKEERKENSKKKDPRKKKQEQKLFRRDGKPYNLNQPKVPFTFDDESDPNNIVLDVTLYK